MGNFVCLCVSLCRYYAFDDGFVREVLGKKLSKGTKKDLDDISAKTGVTLKSCRRQVRSTLSFTMTWSSHVFNCVKIHSAFYLVMRVHNTSLAC